jgi:hypothetical protein
VRAACFCCVVGIVGLLVVGAVEFRVTAVVYSCGYCRRSSYSIRVGVSF